MKSLYDQGTIFRETLLEFRDPAKRARVQDAAALAVGVLMGGGFPTCAAALAALVEREFPEVEWIWNQGQ